MFRESGSIRSSKQRAAPRSWRTGQVYKGRERAQAKEEEEEAGEEEEGREEGFSDGLAHSRSSS